ncbi:hypothetical protein W97_02282 [Coniosporium apollinis CBS 100218]|uniref:RmlD-like substrate binding domain-containing protein n=1 Tax=Coniosporium apollinis (strain CBS 100218) TaxID=1168221 RepID=R7YMB8_CONA1|nr:uncharacterized protein W97_02282 [Coniosporium apollinis CBS 100218]EON63055.1 hypothetical protein W97_02282 [Coniosporium apollinis CBS 100218]
MTRTALITGGTGLLGREVVKEFNEAGWKAIGTGVTRAKPPSIVKLDLLEEGGIERVLDEVKPDVVVHCAADRFPDSVAQNPSRARALNASAPTKLASLTAARGTFLLYISTDYVFSGRPGEAPYKPTSTRDPPNTYGETKAEGEDGVLRAGSDSGNDKILGVVLRVPILYGSGERSESAVGVLVDQVEKAQDIRPDRGEATIKMDDYAQRYPTNTEDVARVCREICELYTSRNTKGKGGELPRILHFSSEDRMTKYQMCEVFAEILGAPMGGLERYRPDEEEAQKEGIKRPYDCHLDTTELRELGVNVSTMDFTGWWRRELRAFRH